MKRSLPLLLLLCSFIATAHAADWRAEADARIERLRKGDFTVTVRDAAGAPLPGVELSYRLTRHAFLFGTAISYAPFSDQGRDGRAYRQFILDNLSGLVCENEMKWYRTERTHHTFNYEPADALLRFATQNGLQMRGHTLFWEQERYAMPWLRRLDPAELRGAIETHLHDIVTRYRGQLVAWDVNNEMLDGDFFRGRLGAAIAPWMFKEAARLDPPTRLFVNEYGIVGDAAKTERYIAMIKTLQAQGAPIGGIGVQVHDADRFTEDPKAKIARKHDRPDWMLTTPVTPEIFLRTLDRLYAATQLPIHLTEISAGNPDPRGRADNLEMLFRLAFSHEAVQAMLLWGFAAKSHWLGADAALMNADNALNAAGVRISHLLREEWTTRGSIKLDDAGNVKLRGFYGVYILTVKMPDGRVVEREVSLTRTASTAVIVL
jgi:endo-1,4-beta-xylanase